MEENDYFRNALFRSNHEPLEILPVESELFKSSEQTKNKPECCEEVKTKIPFCCTIQVPHGFQYVPNEPPNIAYALDCLSVITETCRKTIHVDDCGPVEVTLNLLKVVGCIPYIVNATVEGDCGKDCTCNPNGKHQIRVCCSDSICVNNVLKCSLECVPHHTIDCHNVVVTDLKVTPRQEHGYQLLQITGMIEFKHIPHV
ncbi:ABC transporter permease [Bacillus toyonensis]|uniref:ABC transporter permease n=1 Tax=Bacillus toyonensis TaxID=155322 RepID=UPI000BFCB0C1|nr:ABC transporter permease [Bacillus toyonensis]PHG14136.1 ABC transporter permease [Bacillus toyonensis]